MTAIDRNPRLQRAAPLLIREGLSDDVVRSVQRRLEGDGLTTVDSLLDAIHLTGTAPLESPISAVILGECPAFARRDVYVELSPEVAEPGMCATFVRCVCEIRS